MSVICEHVAAEDGTCVGSTCLSTLTHQIDGGGVGVGVRGTGRGGECLPLNIDTPNGRG